MMCSSPNVQKSPTHQDGNGQRMSQDECRKNIVDRVDLPASKKIERGPTMTQVADWELATDYKEVRSAPALKLMRESTRDVAQEV